MIDGLLEATGPLGDKLGAILVQLPPYVASGPRQRDELGRILSRLAPARAAVEFRHRSWAAEGERQAAEDLLGAHGAAWVCVDAPRIDVASAMPPIVEVTTDALAYLRLHGRNASTWTTGRTVAERFDHVYTDAEMEEWVGPVLDMAERAQEVAVVYNNNARDYALRNATRFTELLSLRSRKDSGRGRGPRRLCTWQQIVATIQSPTPPLAPPGFGWPMGCAGRCAGCASRCRPPQAAEPYSAGYHPHLEHDSVSTGPGASASQSRAHALVAVGRVRSSIEWSEPRPGL